jgi:Ca2+-binding RTX toxin-like protein
LNSTFSGNSAGVSEGAIRSPFGQNITNSIFLGNTAPTNPELSTFKLIASGLNIVGADGSVFDASGNPNIINADPALVFAQTALQNGVQAGVLGDNGGPVPTIALNPDADNPALDAANGDAPAQDARGETRTDQPGVGNEGAEFADLGAAELAPAAILGTSGDDSALAGTDDADLIFGSAGDDTITGGADDDTITGGTGNDDVDGGAGTGDLAVFNGNRADFDVLRLPNGDLRVVNVIQSGDPAEPAFDLGPEGDTLVRNVEFLQFADTGPLAAASFTDTVGRTPFTGGAISLNQPLQSNLDAAGDVDVFLLDFTPERFTNYIIDVEGVDTNGGTLADPLVTFQSFDGGQVSNPQFFVQRDADSGLGQNSQLPFTVFDPAPETGGFLVRVEAENGTDIGSYTVTLRELDDLGDDPNEDNGFEVNPTPITLGQSAEGDLQFSRDADFFSVELEADTSYLINLEGAATGAGSLVDPVLTVGQVNISGTFVANASDDNSGTGQNAQVVFTPTQTGEFIFGVAEAGQDEFGTYTLSVEEFEDDHINFFSFLSPDSTFVNPGDTVDGRIEVQADRDIFNLNMGSQGQRYLIETQIADPTPDGLSDLQFQVLNLVNTGQTQTLATTPIDDTSFTFINPSNLVPMFLQVSQGDEDDVLADYSFTFRAVDRFADGDANLLLGSETDDLIEGLGGNDEIRGLAGDDTLDGGAGDDTMTGGLGDDIFVKRPGQSDDVITDFAQGTSFSTGDKIDISAYDLTYNDIVCECRMNSPQKCRSKNPQFAC